MLWCIVNLLLTNLSSLPIIRSRGITFHGFRTNSRDRCRSQCNHHYGPRLEPRSRHSVGTACRPRKPHSRPAIQARRNAGADAPPGMWAHAVTRPEQSAGRSGPGGASFVPAQLPEREIVCESEPSECRTGHQSGRRPEHLSPKREQAMRIIFTRAL